MAYPLGGYDHDVGGPSGYSYAGVVIRLQGGDSEPSPPRQAVLEALSEIRFSGWLAQPESGWIAAVAEDPDGSVAASGRGVLELGGWLAEALDTAVLAFSVADDRQLTLAGWDSSGEVGRYVSDPSHGQPVGSAILSDPLGAEHAEDFARLAGTPDKATALLDLLSEELDFDSVAESERLLSILRLLGMPQWLVSSMSLPRDVPAGPSARELTRLGAGSVGVAGRLRGGASSLLRRHRKPPPAVPDPPTEEAPDIDPWLL